MKLLHLTFRQEFEDAVEEILDRNGIVDFVRHPRLSSRDCDGKHEGSKVYPGHATAVEALVEDARVQDLLSDLESFQKEKKSHAHLRAAVVPVETSL